MNDNPRFPEEFLGRMETSLGDDFNAFLKAMEQEPPVSVRYHPWKGVQLVDNNGLEHVPWCTLGRYLSERPSFTFDPLFHAGAYYVQEAGSMLIEPLINYVLEEEKTPLVLDLCAAPGGKSTHILSMLDGQGTLVCNEVIPARNKALQHNISKWGYSNVVVIQNDASQIAETGIQFDLIVADVPCSGEGLFRKDADACKEWSPGAPKSCAVRQKKIIENILPALKPGGFILYSTCTFAREENDTQIEALIRHHGFEVHLPETPEGIQRTRYGWQAFPHLVKSEGFWCTLLKKTDNDGWRPGTLSTKNSKKILRKKSTAMEFLQAGDNLIAIELNRNEWVIPERLEELISVLQSKARIQKAGLCAGSVKGKVFLPHVDIAWSINYAINTPAISVDENHAIRFLQGESLNIGSGCDAEVALVQYLSSNLGWIKRSGNHWSNHYPKDFRIRSRRPPVR